MDCHRRSASTYRVSTETRLTAAVAGSDTWPPDCSFDGKPVIGYDPACPGLFWLAGQAGYGIQCADGVARLAGALLLGEALPADLHAAEVAAASLSPQRLR